jgi:alpha-pyrone synthase
MYLSGDVPGRIGAAVAESGFQQQLGDPAAVDCWAVHAGGRSILDAVQHGLDIAPGMLDHSRDVLRAFGNMSSATLMFVLDRILGSRAPVTNGLAMAFGPGLAADGFRFRSAP